MKNKTIFITLAEDIIFRNVFTDLFWNFFLKDCDFKIIILVQEGRKDFFAQKFTGKPLVFEEYKRGTPTKFESFFNSLARSGLNSHTNLWSKMRSYKRGDSGFVDTFYKRILAATLGNFNWYKNLIRYFLMQVEPDKKLADLYDKYKPDMVFSTSLSNYDFDVPVAREAKRRKIHLVGMGRSWDNFSSHGLLRALPDVLLVQNEFLKDMAPMHQAIDLNKLPIKIVGIAHYDPITNLQNIVEPREKFLTRFGLGKNDKYILYGAMGSFLFKYEDELPEVFEELMASGKLNVNKFIYRAHPKFKKTDFSDKLSHIYLDSTGEYAIGNKDGLGDNEYLINSIYHSEVLVTGASTMAIDGAVLDKPIVCVAFNGKTPEDKVNYWESVARFYDLYTHFEDLLDQKGVKVARTPDELASMVNVYIKNPALDSDGRKRIVSRLAYKIDGNSSKRLAEYVLEEVKKS